MEVCSSCLVRGNKTQFERKALTLCLPFMLGLLLTEEEGQQSNAKSLVWQHRILHFFIPAAVRH